MANKAEIRPQEQSEKTESCRENLWNEIQLKGPRLVKRTNKAEIRLEEQSEKAESRLENLWNEIHLKGP